jgi:hypothetical protein
MSRKTVLILAFVGVGAAVAAACGAAFVAPDVSPELVQIGQSQAAGTTQASLQEGHDLFLASCGKGGFCHKLPTPKSRTAERWPQILDKMAPKAGLTAAERDSVQRFILAVRELPAAAK